MSLTFKPAKRENTKPLIGMYSESGWGKTYSALLLARGIAGDAGKIAMLDTESGRGSLYADVIPGGYDVITMEEPFSPQAYIDAITAAEVAGYGVLIIDSASHEWEGIGGVTHMAQLISQKRSERYNKPWDGVVQFGDWKEPKMQHQRFVLKLLQSKLTVIVCLRAKYKSKQIKNSKGKTEIIKDDFTTPIQADDFIFEMTAHMEILKNHSIRLTKCSHPDLRKCFEDGKPITVDTGKRIAEWASGGGSSRDVAPGEAQDSGPKAVSSPAASPTPTEFIEDEEFDNLKARLEQAKTSTDLNAVKADIVARAGQMSDEQKKELNKTYTDRVKELKVAA